MLIQPLAAKRNKPLIDWLIDWLIHDRPVFRAEKSTLCRCVLVPHWGSAFRNGRSYATAVVFWFRLHLYSSLFVKWQSTEKERIIKQEVSHANSYQRFFVGNQPSLAFRDLTRSIGRREGYLTCQSPSLRQNSVFFLRTPVWNPETQINRVDRSKMGQLNKKLRHVYRLSGYIWCPPL